MVVFSSTLICARSCERVLTTCAVGKPTSEKITGSESELFYSSGIMLSSNSKVLVYRKMTIQRTRRTVAAKSSRQTLRDDSCFMYICDKGTNQFGLLKKVVVCDDGAMFAVAMSLTCSGRKLCTDRVTNAQLDSHVIIFNPPR